jgi:hypothetical protein
MTKFDCAYVSIRSVAVISWLYGNDKRQKINVVNTPISRQREPDYESLRPHRIRIYCA